MKRTVLQMLRTSAEKYPKTVYTNQKGDSGWVGLTYPEVLHESRFLAAGLHQLGIEKGDKIAILAEGRNRWLTGEYGISGLFVGVPVKLGKNGIEQIVSLNLTAEEKQALMKSAAAVQELVEAMKKMA